jgi:hypothetical protein
MGVVRNSLRVKVITKLKVTSLNSFRIQQLENYQRRSLAPIRYVARAAH